jgi:hypothetical protein
MGVSDFYTELLQPRERLSGLARLGSHVWRGLTRTSPVLGQGAPSQGEVSLCR